MTSYVLELGRPICTMLEEFEKLRVRARDRAKFQVSQDPPPPELVAEPEGTPALRLQTSLLGKR